jgi:hypothetical protein
MPSGPPELHKKWKDDHTASQYLIDRGYVLTRDWQWDLPHSQYLMTGEEFEAIYYLVHEWDYGGFTDRCRNEMLASSKRPLRCIIGIHKYGPAVRELGPKTAQEMHERSGAIVVMYDGPWKTCVKCNHQTLEGGIPK